MKDLLPINKKEMKLKGWKSCDFIIVTGDAYIDHPSFGTAIISRVLESQGYKVGIIPQPDWNDLSSFNILGKPRLAFLVTSGNMDSMVSNYTVNKNKRKKDLYSPQGLGGKRPDRATIVYCNKIKELYNDSPIIIGGIESSLRRFVHYDYWEDKLRKPILFDTRADILVYGMGEKAIIEIADSLNAGIKISDLDYIRGTCIIKNNLANVYSDFIEIPSYSLCINNKNSFADATLLIYREQDSINSNIIVQKVENRYLIQNAPQDPLESEEFDQIYSLPFTREAHPVYIKTGGIPAFDEVKFSITAQRGCYGGCHFCSLAVHQGRRIQYRSKESIIDEAILLTKMPDFKGYIHDIGGPTANFTRPSCDNQVKHGTCKDRQCLFPEPCKNLKVDHSKLVEILRDLRLIPSIKKVFIRSGIRFDYLMLDKNKDFVYDLVNHHISGQLKVAPEHSVNKVLNLMGKPPIKIYNNFSNYYKKLNNKLNKKQFLIPYFISSHPGCTLGDAISLAEYINEIGHMPQQVQDFYPTPGSISTAMYYSEIDIFSKRRIYVAKSPMEKKKQRALMQYGYKENYNLVYDILNKCGRPELIGFERKCLIRPPSNNKKNQRKENKYDNQGKNRQNKLSGKKKKVRRINKRRD